MILQELLVPLLLDSSKFDSGIDSAINKSGSLTNGLSKVGGIVFGGAVAGIGLLTAGLFDATKGAMNAELIQSDLNAVIKSTGGVAGMTAQAVNDLSTSLAKVTMFEDDVITSGQNMLLTFTGIGKEVFPQATEAMLNMAQKMGKDPVDMALMLGKALNSPADGLSALTRNGVVFTAEQEKMIKTMQESGDIAGAQGIILGELEKEFGGVAEAAGSTTAGTLTRFNNLMGDMKEKIGGAIIPALTTLGQTLLDTLNKPEVQAFIDNLVLGIQSIATNAVTYIPVIIQGFSDFVSFLQNNQGIVVGVLAALGVAVLAFGISVATATWTALAPLLPVIAVMALVGLAVYALYEAWQSNFMGIQDKVKAVWAYLQPVFESIKTWFSVNIPIAIQTVSNYWNNVLLPAMMKVWDFMKQYLFPLFEAVGKFISLTFLIAWQNLSKFWNESVSPAIQKLGELFNTYIMPVLQKVGDYVGGKLIERFNLFKGIILTITEVINKMVGALEKIAGVSPSISTFADKGTVHNPSDGNFIPPNISSAVQSGNNNFYSSNSGSNSTNLQPVLNEERLSRLIVSAMQQGR